jgi:hypothetical protein
MSFTTKDWEDAPSETTPITAVALEDMETRVTNYADTITANTQTADYTLVLADRGKVVEANHATNAIVITVPPNSSVAFPTGTLIEVHRYGAGAVAIAAGAGVTIRSPGGHLDITDQYDTVALRKRATDEWVAVGNLS